MILYNVNDSKPAVNGNNSNSELVYGVSFQAFAVLQWRSLFFSDVPPHYWAMPNVSRQCVGFIFKGQAAYNSCLAALPLKIKVLCSFETPETTHSITQHHIPEDLNFHG
jgi:hypothetical protein